MSLDNIYVGFANDLLVLALSCWVLVGILVLVARNLTVDDGEDDTSELP